MRQLENCDFKLTDDVDHAATNDGPLATDHVRDVTSNDSTNEGTGGQDRGNQRGVAGGEGITLHEWASIDFRDEERRVEDTVDVTGVVTEEDTSERGKGAKEVGLPCDRRLDAVDIGGSDEATSHDSGVWWGLAKGGGGDSSVDC
jgi:hypothetical protein